MNETQVLLVPIQVRDYDFVLLLRGPDRNMVRELQRMASRMPSPVVGLMAGWDVEYYLSNNMPEMPIFGRYSKLYDDGHVSSEESPIVLFDRRLYVDAGSFWFTMTDGEYLYMSIPVDFSQYHI